MLGPSTAGGGSPEGDRYGSHSQILAADHLHDPARSTGAFYLEYLRSIRAHYYLQCW